MRMRMRMRMRMNMSTTSANDTRVSEKSPGPPLVRIHGARDHSGRNPHEWWNDNGLFEYDLFFFMDFFSFIPLSLDS